MRLSSRLRFTWAKALMWVAKGLSESSMRHLSLVVSDVAKKPEVSTPATSGSLQELLLGDISKSHEPEVKPPPYKGKPEEHPEIMRHVHSLFAFTVNNNQRYTRWQVRNVTYGLTILPDFDLEITWKETAGV